jgi:hypothetical protein
MPFVKGQSGNPAGRPLGARNKETLAIEARLEARAAEIVDVAIGRAVRGDTPALRMCLDRILPRRRDRPVPFVLPPVVGAAAAERAVEDITAAVGTGELTIPEALGLLQIVEKSARIVAAARAAPQADIREAAVPRAEAVGTAEPARSGSRGDRQTAEETIKYNEPPGAANGAAESGPHIRARQDGAVGQPPLEGEGRERSEWGGVKATSTELAAGASPPPDRASARSTSPLQGEVMRRPAHGLEKTTKCNEPIKPANGGAETQRRSKGEETQRATKYNGPPGLLDGVAHFILPSAGAARPIVPLARAAPPKLSSAA